MKDLKNKKFRHYKGGIYIVSDIAIHTETLKWMVVYKAVSDGAVWVRPIEMFLEDVSEGVKRFTLID